ncbi:MAG: hypothetical protein QF599_04730 [Planctomycetota bacterium]|nr:hypothetical protein [Planctomycetota bacterium]
MRIVNRIGMVAGVLACVLFVHACQASGKTNADVKFPNGTTVSCGFGWEASGADDFCACVTWLDKNGDPLDAPPGVIAYGSGGGVTPEGAAGWSAKVVDCEEIGSCGAHAPGGPVLGAGPRGASLVAGERVRFCGYLLLDPDSDVLGDEESITFDLYITANSEAEHMAALQQVIRQRASYPLPGNVEVVQLTVGKPQFSGEPSFDSFLGYEVTAYDDQQLNAFAVQLNGREAFSNGPGNYAGNGYFTNSGFVPEVLIEQDWSGTSNSALMMRAPAGETPFETKVTTTWTPDQ